MTKPSDQPTPVVDQMIAEVHRHKRAIMAGHGDDVEELLKDLRNRQKANPGLVLNRPSAVVRIKGGGILPSSRGMGILPSCE